MVARVSQQWHTIKWVLSIVLALCQVFWTLKKSVGGSGMRLYALIRLPDFTGAHVFAVFSHRDLAERVAEDPYEAMRWELSHDLEMVEVEVPDSHHSPQVFYAASTADPKRSGNYSVYGLFTSWGEAEAAAGESGLVSKVIVDEYVERLHED
jgi:hypothetical protein